MLPSQRDWAVRKRYSRNLQIKETLAIMSVVERLFFLGGFKMCKVTLVREMFHYSGTLDPPRRAF